MANTLSLEQKVGQLFFIGLPGTAIDATAQKLLEDISPGGICLFARNCKDAKEIRTLLDDLRGILPRMPFLSLDQEGGLVDRLRKVVEPMPSPADVSKKGDSGDVEKLASITAELIRILGFNMNFAPVIDVIDEDRLHFNNGLFSRAFGNSTEDVVELAGLYSETLFESGIMPCFKHFPGYGATKVDSHDDLPGVGMTRAELFAKDLVPYLKLLHGPAGHAVMTGHAVFPNLDIQETDTGGKLLPTSLSGNIVNGLLRDELKFDGISLTDDLEMGAIIKNYGIGEACKLAVLAGHDFLLICNDIDRIYEGYQTVLETVKNGSVTEERLDESLFRIETARSHLKEPLQFSSERIEELSLEIRDLKNKINS